MNEIVKNALDNYYKLFPEDKEINQWSGCNYYRNTGNNDAEPVGTATSMHDCECCRSIEKCTLIRETRIWEYNEQIEEDLTAKAREMDRFGLL